MQESLNKGSVQSVSRDVSEVHRALSSIEDIIWRYDDLVLRLSDKLSPITISEPATENNKLESKYQTLLANDIDTLYQRLKTITNTLESLYSRLEI